MSDRISEMARENVPCTHASCRRPHALISAVTALPFVVPAASDPEVEEIASTLGEPSGLESSVLDGRVVMGSAWGGSSFNKSSVGLGLRRLWGRVTSSPSALVVTGVGGSTEMRLRSRVSSSLILGEKVAPSGETPSGRLLRDWRSRSGIRSPRSRSPCVISGSLTPEATSIAISERVGRSMGCGTGRETLVLLRVCAGARGVSGSDLSGVTEGSSSMRGIATSTPVSCGNAGKPTSPEITLGAGGGSFQP